MTKLTKVYGVAEAARLVGVSEATLRDYDKRGVVHPVRDGSGRRIFTDTDVKRAKEYRERGNGGSK
jgi:DNA-binding transcriptional MerR regulator